MHVCVCVRTYTSSMPVKACMYITRLYSDVIAYRSAELSVTALRGVQRFIDLCVRDMNMRVPCNRTSRYIQL